MDNSVIKLFARGLVAFFATFILLSSFSIVGAGQRGVKVTLGSVADEVIGEGIHFKIPLIQRVKKIDVRTQKNETQASSASKDLQSVDTIIALNYHVVPTSANKLYQEIGDDYEERIIAPSIQESVKSATAKFTAQELITKRPEVKVAIRDDLTERLGRNYINVDEVSIVNFTFSKEFDAAIEAKQTAEQNAQKAENDLRRIEVEAKQEIEKAKAEAEGIRIRAEALQNNQQLVELNAIEKWDGKLPQYMTGATPFINLQK